MKVLTPHRLINNNRQDTRCCLFKIQGFFVHSNPEAAAHRSYAHAALNYKAEKEHTSNSIGPLPQDYYERKNLNLEKTTSIVSYLLLLINLWYPSINATVNRNSIFNFFLPNDRCRLQIVEHPFSVYLRWDTFWQISLETAVEIHTSIFNTCSCTNKVHCVHIVHLKPAQYTRNK